MSKIESENRLERQKERADNFFDKTKNSLRWILNGNRPKNFQISTIFTVTLKLAIFRRENQKERQKERADNFFDETENCLRWILKGNRPKNFKILTIFTITLELAIFKRENQKKRQKEQADIFFDKTKNYLRWILKGNRSKKFQISTIFTNRPEMV